MIRDSKEFQSFLPAGFDGVWHWDYLNGAFPRKIMPMDWDAVVELNGHFLVFETKKLSAEIPKGQMMAFKRAVQTGIFIVVFIWGKDQPYQMQILTKNGLRDKVHCNKQDVFNFAKKWSEWAEKQKRPTTSTLLYG